MGELEPEVTKKDESFDRTVKTTVHESSFSSSSSSSEEDSIEDGTCGKAKVLPPGERDEQQRILRRSRTVRVMILAAVVVAAVIGATLAATSRTDSSTAANIPDDFPSSGHGGGAGPKTQEGNTTSRPGPGVQNAGTTAAPQEAVQLPPPSYGGSPPSVNCNTPPAWADDDMGWDDLTSDQRSAASYLGYTQSLWNDEDFWNTGGTGTREEAYFNARYADLEWTDLTVIQQVAFAYLGYGSGSYSDFYNDYSFDELPADVQAAADAVGYDRDVWDSCTAEVCSSQVDNDLWQDHSRTERANLKVLGYTCWTWNNYDFGSGGRRGRV